jgi:hypothetical protein
LGGEAGREAAGHHHHHRHREQWRHDPHAGLYRPVHRGNRHRVEWVTLEENVLRQRVTTDITTKGGQFDIMTIGMYETPIWGANGWLVPLDDLSDDYDVDDILPAMRGGLSHDGTLYAAPFYGESSMVMYRTDLMEAGRAGNARGADLGVHPRSRRRHDRPRQRHQRHLPARQGRLGRRRRLHHRDRQLVRRALVRRGLERPVRSARMGRGAELLRRHDERIRPRRAMPPTASTRTCRCSSRACAACGSTPPLRRPS